MDGYKVLTDVDNVGYDIRQASTFATFNAASMAATCNADLNCKGFNNGGWLKTVVVVRGPSAGICLYIKRACKMKMSLP